MTDSNHLSLALDRLDALAMGDGRYMYRDDNTRQWYAVEVSELEDLGRRLKAGEPDAYSLWCAETSAEELGPERSAPGTMVVPPECAGQIVEVSYSEGWSTDGYCEAFKRVYDRSDRSEQWYYADCSDLDDDAYDPVNRAPRGLTWHPCVVID